MSQKRLLRICPVCGKPDLKFLPQHLSQVHSVNKGKERKLLLKQALYSTAQLYSNINLISPRKILIDNHEEQKMNQSVPHCNKICNSDEDNASEIVDWVDHTKYYK